MNEFVKILSQALNQNNLTLTSDAQQKLIHYLELMQKWNKVFNLTSITDPREMVYLHLIDSLVVAPFLHGKRMLDVGTGAGLPGIPLAIMIPETEWVLVDKNNKKVNFLTQVCAELKLQTSPPFISGVKILNPRPVLILSSQEPMARSGCLLKQPHIFAAGMVYLLP